jgi:hypothetical protein
MFPSTARVDHRDQASCNAEVGSNSALALATRAALADYQNVLLGQLGVQVTFALERASVTDQSTLPACVGQVLSLGTAKQVGGITTRRVVAVMTGVLAFIKRSPLVQFKYDPMSSGHLASVEHNPISGFGPCSCPRPTRVGAGRGIDFREYAVSRRRPLARTLLGKPCQSDKTTAFARTVNLGLATGARRGELRAAAGAGKLRVHRNLLCSGATPRGVPTPPRHCLAYSTTVGHSWACSNAA